MIEVNKSMLENVLNASQANVATVTFADAAKDSTTDVSQNIFDEKDVIVFPKTAEEMEKCLREETYPNLLDNNGVARKGKFMFVFVKNAKTGLESIKKFRPSAITATFAEYRRDDANACYIATGNVVNPASDAALVQKLKEQTNLADQFKVLIGKKLIVDHKVAGNAARMEGRNIVGIRRRELCCFKEYAEA